MCNARATKKERMRESVCVCVRERENEKVCEKYRKKRERHFVSLN